MSNKIDWKSLIRMPLFWIGVWILFPFLCFILYQIIFNLGGNLLARIIEKVLLSYVYTFPLSPLILGIWELIYGINISLKKGKKKGKLHIGAGIVLIIITIFLTYLLFFNIYSGFWGLLK